jgi:hypothetical protein
VKQLFAVAALLGVFAAGEARAASSVTATLEPERLAAGQTTMLRIQFQGDFGPRTAPTLSLSNFEVVAGPSIENRFSWINGQATHETILLYRLRALKPGPATVGALRFQSSSGTVTETPPMTATVEKGDAAVPATPGRRSDPALVSQLDPPSPFVGQQAVWTVYVLTRGELTQAEIKSLPDFKGFWTEELDREPNVSPRIWNLDGVAWRAYPIARKALFPNHAGKLAVGEARAVAVLRRDFFDFFGNTPFGEPPAVEVASPELSLTCRPLPGDESAIPVGTFTLKTWLDRKELSAGDSTTLTAQISGDGRLNDLPAPPLSAPGMRISEPESKLSWKRNSARLTSQRQWQWILTAEEGGHLTIPSVEVTVFDPAAGAVRRVSAPPLTIAVSKPAPPPAPTPAAEPVRESRTGRAAVAPAGVAAAAVALSLLLLGVGFFLGKRKHSLHPGAAGTTELDSPERHLEALLEKIAANSRLARRQEAREQLEEIRRRFDEIRFGPQLSSREEAARDLRQRALRLARSLSIRA